MNDNHKNEFIYNKRKIKINDVSDINLVLCIL